MKRWIGLLMIVVGVVFGFYVGGWIFFVGGIVDLIASVRADVFVPMDVAIGVAKIFFAGVAGKISALFLCVPGYLMMEW